MATPPKRVVKKAKPEATEAAAKAAPSRGKTAKAAAPRPRPRLPRTARRRAPSRREPAPGRPAAAVRGRRALVIVESPTKAKTIGKYLGPGYDVRATIGHVRDLPTRELGVDVERGFEPKYVTIKGKTKTLSELKKAAKRATTIFLATDPDREGEAIAWHVADQLDTGADPPHSLPRDHQGRHPGRAARPGKIDDRKVDAQQARRILDRLVGYKASPMLWHTIKTGLSAGRVQTVALRLIVERERDIRAFKPQEYWTIEALCAGNGQTFEAALHKVDGHKPQLDNEADARAVVDAVREEPFVVSKVEKRQPEEVRPRRSPPARCSRKPPRSWASPPGAPCARRRTSTRARTSGEEGRSVSSPTCEPTPRGVGHGGRVGADFIGRATPSRTCRTRPTRTATRRPSRVQGAHEAIRPTECAPAGAGAAVPRARPVPALPAHLAAVRGVADDARGLRHDHRGLRSRPVPVPGHRLRPDIRRIPHALHRGAREGRGQDDGRPAAHPAARRRRTGGGPGDHPLAALYRAAAALLRGQPGQGARAARHRAAVHVQRHHLDAVGAGVRQGGAAPLLPDRAGRDGREDHGRQVPRDLQRRVHLRHGERAGPDRRRRAGLAARARRTSTVRSARRSRRWT